MQFYIQQLGETEFRPLDASQTTLSESQYQIIAESSLKQGEKVDIRMICHHPHHPHVRETTTTVDHHGRLSILPIQLLKAGQWEIYCRSDLIAEMVGNYWEYSLILNVEPTFSLPELMPFNLQGMTPLDGKQNSETIHLISLENVPDSGENCCNAVIPEKTAITEENIPQAFPKDLNTVDTSVNLHLASETLYRRMGEEVLVSGDIEGKNPHLSHLCYELRHPLSDEVLYCEIQPLNPNDSPLTFQHSFPIPDEWEMPLLTLNLQVISAMGEILQEKNCLIETEIVDYLNYTLELADTDTNTAYTFDIALEKPLNPPNLSVDLPKPSRLSPILRPLKRSASTILPPKLDPSSRKSSTSKTLALPKFK